jgi:2-iminobutanoate/2-iminopropanoate deaminase
VKGKSMSRTAITAQNAVAIGPYSHAVEAGDVIYLSGQTPIDPGTGQLVVGDVSVQAEQCFSNLYAVLRSAGLDSDSVIKVNVFLVDMNDFAAMNAVYKIQFDTPYPARKPLGSHHFHLEQKLKSN